MRRILILILLIGLLLSSTSCSSKPFKVTDIRILGSKSTNITAYIYPTSTTEANTPYLFTITDQDGKQRAQNILEWTTPQLNTKGGFGISFLATPSEIQTYTIQSQGSFWSGTTQESISLVHFFTVSAAIDTAAMGIVPTTSTKTSSNLPVWIWLFLALAILVVLIAVVKHYSSRSTGNTPSKYPDLLLKEKTPESNTNSTSSTWTLPLDTRPIDTTKSETRHQEEAPLVDSTKETVETKPMEPPKLDWKVELRQEIINFKPNWTSRERHGQSYLKYGKTRMKLLGGENGTNGNLAYYLRKKGLDTQTEITLKGGRRADIIVNKVLVLECKEHLTSKRTLWGLEREIQDQKKFNPHIVWALIYGDIKNEYYNKLCSEFGKDTIIVKGEILSSRFDRDEDLE